jgi:hypothetical protein
MAKKAEQRFTWNRNPTTGVVLKTDTITGETFETSLDLYPDVIQENFTVYGITKIFDDRGSQVPADEKISFCQALQMQLIAGNWKAERTGGIHLLPLVIEAIMEEKNWKVAKAQAAYRRLDEEQRIILKGNLKERMLAISEARKADESEEDLDDLLS